MRDVFRKLLDIFPGSSSTLVKRKKPGGKLGKPVLRIFCQ